MKTTKKTAAKIAWTALALVMAFSLASCGSGYDDNNSGEIDNTNTNGDNANNGNGKTPTVAETKTTLDYVGDIYLSDGTVIAFVNASKMSSEQKAKAEAVVFYVGSADSVLGNRTLAVNVKNSGTTSYVWAPASSKGYTKDFTDLQCVRTSVFKNDMSYVYTYDNKLYYVTGDLDGSDNWEKIKATDPAGTADDVVAENYPAFNYVNTELGENYYLPTLAELEELITNLTAVNASITAAGGTTLNSSNWWSSAYWSSSQAALDNVANGKNTGEVWCVNLSNGYAQLNDKYNSVYVCGVRAFTN